MTWMLATIGILVVLHLRTAKNMWEYLKKVYSHNNMARWFQLEYEIANYTHEDLSIQEHFTGFQIL